MANMKTRVLTTEQYKEIIQTMREGFTGCRPNNRIATALVLEANLGIRISDIVKLRLCDIVRDGGRYHLEITEQKTGKRRVFTVPDSIYGYIVTYAMDNGIGKDERLFPIRKFFATEIYKNNGYDIALVQQLLQHSSTAVTQRYIGIAPQRIEAALSAHSNLI